MDFNVLYDLRKAKYDYSKAQVCFYNNGKIRTENNDTATHTKDDNSENSIKAIRQLLIKAIQFYSKRCDFDTISMDLELGIIYDINDVNEDNTIKENKEPIQDIVRVYNGTIMPLLNNEQTNDFDYGDTCFGVEDYVRFDTLKKLIDESGLSYVGPRTFNELKDRIQSGEKFNVNVTANLVGKEIEIQKAPKEEKKQTSKIKKLLFK